MTGEPDTRRMLAPLWGLATGVAVGSGAAFATGVTGPPALHWGLGAVGAGVALLAAGRRRPFTWWAVSGVFLALACGLPVRASTLEVARLSTDDTAAVRATVVVIDGWRPTRWGYQATVDIEESRRAHVEIPLTGRGRLEVRGVTSPTDLPTPGSRRAVLASPRGPPSRPRLVASSPIVLRGNGPPVGLHALRDRPARTVLTADVARIRAAELACALVLGRRDLLPEGRLDGWRRSGLAHMLAVSGLHVGLIGGAVWLVALAAGARLRTGRIAVLVALPA